jgi:hypothetical protein
VSSDGGTIIVIGLVLLVGGIGLGRRSSNGHRVSSWFNRGGIVAGGDVNINSPRTTTIAPSPPKDSPLQVVGAVASILGLLLTVYGLLIQLKAL